MSRGREEGEGRPEECGPRARSRWVTEKGAGKWGAEGRSAGLLYLRGRHGLLWDQRGRWDQLHPEREDQEAQVSCQQMTPGQAPLLAGPPTFRSPAQNGRTCLPSSPPPEPCLGLPGKLCVPWWSHLTLSPGAPAGPGGPMGPVRPRTPSLPGEPSAPLGPASP